MSEETSITEILQSIGGKINEATEPDSQAEPMDSNIIISSLYKIATTNQKLLRSALDIYISYFDSFEDERNNDYEKFNNIISISCDKEISPFKRFDAIRPLLYILHCLSDTLISSIIHNLVDIFNQMLVDSSELSKVPFLELNSIKKHYLNDYTFSDKLLANCYDYIHGEFENSNSPGSALAYGLIIQQLQKNHISAEFTDRLLKFCFKSDIRFQCIGCFLIISYVKSEGDYIEVIPKYIYESLKVFLVSENKTLQIISCKAARTLISEHIFDDIDYFKPLLQQYSYYDDLFLYQRLISTFINSFDTEIYDDSNDNPVTEIIKYLATFLHEQISNEKTKSSEKDTFLYFAGIVMLQDPKSYGQYYEDDIVIASQLLNSGAYTKGPAAFFVGSSSFPNRSVSKIIIESVPRLIEFALNSENDYRVRRSVTDSLAIIISNPLYKVLLPKLLKFREHFINTSPASSIAEYKSDEEMSVEQIPCHIVIGFFNLVPHLTNNEAEDVGKLIVRVILSTTESFEFEICLKILNKLLKLRKIVYSIVQPVISAILEGQLPVFFGIPVYLYNGDSTSGCSANRISKLLSSYIKSAVSQGSMEVINPLVDKLLEWLPLSIDFTYITVLRPIVQCIKYKCITNEDDIENIISLLLEIPQIILPKDFPESLSAAAEIISILLERHPDLFQVSKLLDFCNNIDLEDFEEVEEEEEAENEEESETENEGENETEAEAETESSMEMTEGESTSSNMSVIVTERENIVSNNNIINNENVTQNQSAQQVNLLERRERRHRSSELIFTSSDRNNADNLNDDGDELNEACELIHPFKVKIVFLCFTLKELNSIEDDVQSGLFDGFEYMFANPKLGISPSLLNLSLQIMKMSQSNGFKDVLATNVIDFIFSPNSVLKKHGIDDSVLKEVVDKLVSIFKEQKKLYNDVRTHCQLDRSKYMMFNTYFRKLD